MTSTSSDAMKTLFGSDRPPRYEWRASRSGVKRIGGGVKGSLPAQEVGEYLEALRREIGELTPRTVVEAARPPGSKLHKLFTWDDSEAGERYREVQARAIIGSVVAIYRVATEDEDRRQRAFISVTNDEHQHHYTHVAVALSDRVMRQQVLERAWDELTRWVARYRHLEEFAQLFQAIDEIRPTRSGESTLPASPDQPPLNA